MNDSAMYVLGCLLLGGFVTEALVERRYGLAALIVAAFFSLAVIHKKKAMKS